jgi:signal transduction histidine kinase
MRPQRALERLRHYALAVLFVSSHSASPSLCKCAITTVAALLEAATGSPATKDRARGVITRQTEHLRRLVDDLLDLSRMTRNELQRRRANMDICEVVEDCGHSIEPDVKGRGIRFASSVPNYPVSAVVKGLTEVHGGTVRATSPGPGRGCEFIVTLPNNVRSAA